MWAGGCGVWARGCSVWARGCSVGVAWGYRVECGVVVWVWCGGAMSRNIHEEAFLRVGGGARGMKLVS